MTQASPLQWDRTFQTKRQRLHQDEAEHPFHYEDEAEKCSKGKYEFHHLKQKSRMASDFCCTNGIPKDSGAARTGV